MGGSKQMFQSEIEVAVVGAERKNREVILGNLPPDSIDPRSVDLQHVARAIEEKERLLHIPSGNPEGVSFSIFPRLLHPRSVQGVIVGWQRYSGQVETEGPRCQTKM